MPRAPAREALALWALVLGALAVVSFLGGAIAPLGQALGPLAVAAFLVAPTPMLERRGEDARDAGLRFDSLPRDLAFSLLACAAVLPLFTIGWGVLLRALPHAPLDPRPAFPFRGTRALSLALPERPEIIPFLGRVAGNAAVALAEEYFYRGYLTLRLEERFPPRLRVLGAPLGLAAVLSSALFAVGHLLVPSPFRLATFFPGLLFAWLRARTGTVIGAAICHFLANVWLLFLRSG